MGCCGRIADLFTKPCLLNTRFFSHNSLPRPFPQKMADVSSLGALSRAGEGLKLVYTPSPHPDPDPAEEFQARVATPADADATENGSGSDDGASTSFKPRRAFCLTCRKAQSLCICVRIKTVVDNKVGITILQHPEEKDHHLGTARIAALSLRNVEVLSIPEGDARTSFRVRLKVPGSKRSIAGRVGNKGRKKAPPETPPTTKLSADEGAEEDEDSDQEDAVPAWLNLPAGAGLLFPSDKAIDLVPELCGNAKDCPTHLIVLDGTWSKAKRIYFENLWLHKLRHYNLPPSNPSMYGSVRREPKIGCLSTVESIVFALRMLEPGTVGLESLLEVFDSMIEDAKGFQAQTELRYQSNRLSAE